MQSLKQHHDVVVVGGGLAGVSAAVAAARLGSDVALITNRPVLGGNSSSEIRVWVVGATAHGTQRFARETGIMGELFLENQYRNPQGNAIYWDQVVLDLVRAEPRVHLHLNTDVRTVTTSDDRISSVTGWTMGSEIETEFTAPIFLDCTGDGLIGALAGADFRIGREGRDEHGEPWAPERADSELLGSSIFFSTHDTGRPERFVPPSIAIDLSATPILANRAIRTGDNGCNYWWIEWGGELDTVAENERIRDELWGVVYGIWDHIKNSGEFDAETLTLDWVGAIPGKREYRRFVGDHTLTQQDLLEQRTHPDAVAFGGWSIDLHPVEGVYAETAGAQQRYTDGTYDIPFRSLYSANVPNLLFAGRNISASHIAFGSTRVMATCATQGQAAGTAAHLASRHGLTPRQLGGTHIDLLQQTLIRQDAPLIGVPARDDADLARRARVTASSELAGIDTTPWATDDRFRLDRDAAVVLPVDPALGELRITTDAVAEAELQIELWTTGKPQNYAPIEHVSTHSARVPAGEGEAVVDLGFSPADACNAVVVIRRCPDVSLVLTSDHPYGLLALRARTADDEHFDDHIAEEDDQPVTDWEARSLRGRSFALRAAGPSEAWRASRAVDGLQRPFGGPHLWSSEAGDGAAELSLEWDEPVELRELRLVWNDDVDADLINLHHHRTPWVAVPTLARDYVVEAEIDGELRQIVAVEGNRRRHLVHALGSVRTSSIRIRVTATNGSPFVTLSAVKAY